MKRITFLGFVLILLASILFGRVNWGVSDSLNNIVIRPGTSIPINAVEIHPAPFPFPWASSVTPPHYRQNSEYGAEFIGVDYRGWCGRIGGTYTFKRQLGSFIDSISQAIIWFCADDTVDQIGVKWDGTTRWETNIPANHYAGNNQMYEIHRVDLTDLFLGYDYTSVCSLIIPVRNTTISYIGLNYFYTIEDSIELTAYDSYSITKGWNYISMPFRVADTSYSLSSLFPGVTEAWYGNEYLCDWDSLDVSAHLTGELGDICRSRSLLLWSDSTDQILVYGYPIYEQHYMDKRPQTTNFQFLFHGTVNCIVPYNCSLKQPDDIGDSCVVLAAHEKSYGELLIYSFVDSINIFSSPCFEGYYSVFDFDSCCHLAL